MGARTSKQMPSFGFPAEYRIYIPAYYCYGGGAGYTQKTYLMDFTFSGCAQACHAGPVLRLRDRREKGKRVGKMWRPDYEEFLGGRRWDNSHCSTSTRPSAKPTGNTRRVWGFSIFLLSVCEAEMGTMGDKNRWFF